jgi:ribosomal protein L37AE/L43A
MTCPSCRHYFLVLIICADGVYRCVTCKGAHAAPPPRVQDTALIKARRAARQCIDCGEPAEKREGGWRLLCQKCREAKA